MEDYDYAECLRVILASAEHLLEIDAEIVVAEMNGNFGDSARLCMDQEDHLRHLADAQEQISALCSDLDY